jgi:hypothetical protein
MATRARDRATDARGCAARECANATFFRFTLATATATDVAESDRRGERSVVTAITMKKLMRKH